MDTEVFILEIEKRQILRKSQEIVRRLLVGQTYEKTAQDLGISENAVMDHAINSVCDRLSSGTGLSTLEVRQLAAGVDLAVADDQYAREYRLEGLTDEVAADLAMVHQRAEIALRKVQPKVPTSGDPWLRELRAMGLIMTKVSSAIDNAPIDKLERGETLEAIEKAHDAWAFQVARVRNLHGVDED